MYFTFVRNQSVSCNNSFVLRYLLLVVALFISSAGNGQTVEVSSQPYPVGSIRILREKLTSQTYRFDFTNLSVVAAENMRSRSQSWLLAGTRGQVPTVNVESMNFALIEDGRETSSTATPPPQVAQGLVRFDDLGLLRQMWTFTMNLKTASPASQGGYWVLKDASVIVDIGQPAVAAPQAVTDRFNSDFGEDRLPPGLLLNSDIDSSYYTADYNDPVEAWTSWTKHITAASAKDGLFKFSIYSGGFYRLSAEEFSKATTSPVATPASQWKIYRNGQEVAVLPDPVDPSKAVYLPVAQSPADGLHEMVYWADTSGGAGTEQKPLRLAATPGPASTGTSVTETAVLNITHREFENYNPKLKPGPGADRWYWADLSADAPARLVMTMPDYYAPAAGTTVKTEIKYGFSNFPTIQPELVLHIGTHETQRVKLTTQLGTAVLDVPANAFKPGENEIAFRLDYPIDATTKRPVVIQEIRTQWDQPLVPPTGAGYFFRSANGESTSGTVLQFAQSVPPTTAVFGFIGSEPSLLAAQDNTVRIIKDGIQEYLVANTAEPDSVSNIRKIADPFTLAAVKSAKSVIIAAPELIEGAQTLVQSHKARGLDAIAYSVDDLYNVFSYGRPDPQGIRQALRYMFYQAAGEPVEYVTLIGEASDFRGDPDLAPPGVQLDMIPASAANTPESPQGDEKYAAAIGGDLVADFIVGRIPAGNAEDLAGYIEKATAFEQAPGGPWSRVTEFVMDDNDEFPDVVSRIQSAGMSPISNTRLFRQWDYEYVPNLRVQGQKRSWSATENLLEKFNEGLGILNFFGHGGPNLWSHERLLHLSDMKHIQNREQLPLITCASCDNAWITYPMPPVNASMGELMVLKPDGGAIGLFGPVSGASPYEHATLVQGLMEGVLRVQLRRTGDATFYAKNIYYGITRSASIPEQYLLLGDPTVSIRMPTVEPVLSITNPEERAGSGAHAVVSLSSSVTLASTGTLKLLKAEDNSELASMIVNPRQTRWDLQLPADYEGGCVMAILEWRDNGMPRFGGTSFAVLPPSATGVEDKITHIETIGDTFELISVPESNRTGSRATPVYGFGIKANEAIEGPVRVVASRDGNVLTEVSGINPTTGTAFTDFQISAKLADDREVKQISLEVYPQGIGDVDPVTTATFSIPPQPVAELEFVPGTARVYSESGELVSGGTVMLEAVLRNTGAVTAEKVSLQALNGDPSTGTELMTINDAMAYRLDTIRPGESKKVIYRWEGSAKGTYPEIYLVANRNKVVPESDLNNNSILMPPFEVDSLGNFAVEEFLVEPRFVTPGTTVSVTAVFSNDKLRNKRPVEVEIGWERPFDKETTEVIKLHTEFQNGMSTITRQIQAVEGFTHLFVNVNSNLELEEANGGDNTKHSPSMIVYDVSDFTTSHSLSNALSWGAKYNLDMPFDGILQVATDFTSTTDYLILDTSNVMTGRAETKIDPADNAWTVLPWRVSVGTAESPGGIEFRLPMSTLPHEVPGRLIAYLIPYPGSEVPVEVRNPGADWRAPNLIGDKTHRASLDFGIFTSRNGAISWSMKKSGTEGFHMEYLYFRPNAVEWESPPLLLGSQLRSTDLKLAIDTDEGQWDSAYLDWRTGKAGEGGNILWESWQTSKDEWTATVSSSEYLQFRIIAVPEEGVYPYLGNIRITR